MSTSHSLLLQLSDAARAVVAIEDLYRALDKDTRKLALDGFEIKHREAMDALRAVLAELPPTRTLAE